jgi:hypothetical protein
MSAVPALRLAEQQAADGSTLYDLVADGTAGERVIYRHPDRAHAADVLADLQAGRLRLADVQAVMQQVVLARQGGPRTLLFGRVAVPIPVLPGRPQDRWARARERIEQLRVGRLR